MSYQITKTRLQEMYRAYAVNTLNIDGVEKVLFASEEKGYPCVSYELDNLDQKEVVWEEGGGCMSIIQVPNSKNSFLTIRDFYLKETPSQSRLVLMTYLDNKWVEETVYELPFLHRFDVFEYENEIRVVLSVIADEKDFKDDWSRPGSIYIGTLKDNKLVDVEMIFKDLYRNHGYLKVIRDGVPHLYISGDQGVFELTPSNGTWVSKMIFDQPTSEVAFLDIDNDGFEEMLTIEPFHGNKIRMYKFEDEKASMIYEYPNIINFGHAIVSGTLDGKSVFVCGVRREDCELFILDYDNGEIVSHLVENSVGPANLKIINSERGDFIASSNHSANELALYRIERNQ